MKLVKLAKRSAEITLSFILMVQFASAQCENKSGFARKACEAANAAPVSPGVDGSALTGMKDKPLSTTFADSIHLDTLPPDMEPKAFRPLLKLDRTDEGAFLLKVGIYEAYVQSYSLDANPASQRVGAYFPAPIKGRRAAVIADALKQIELHPDVPQSDVQTLLLQIASGADLEKMQPPVQQTAARVLSKDMLASLKGSVEAKTVETTLLNIVNRRLKNPLGAKPQGTKPDKSGQPSSAARADVDTSGDGSSAGDGPVLRGTWAQMPGGFYVRYLPEGYTKVRVQVLVPDAAMAQADPKSPLSFDPTQYLAVYSQAPMQRLGISLRPAK